MKTLLALTALALLTLTPQLQAQNTIPSRDVDAEIAADPMLSYGNDYPYRYKMGELTPAPEGYKPFYISHYGRHGSRYYWSDGLYGELDSLLTAAHDRQTLTPAGEAFREHLHEAMPELTAGWGELTGIGWDQHQQIARTMYNRFPEVFVDGSHVSAVSSLQGRCVISMAAFCLELKECNPKVEISEQSSRSTLHAVVPGDRQNPQWQPYQRMMPRFVKSGQRMMPDTTLVPRIMERLFTSREGLTQSPHHIVSQLKNLYTSLPSIGHEGMMEGIYTDEDVVSEWEQSNLGSYIWVFGPQRESLPILQDILHQASEVIEGRSSDVASLRFGHDTYLGPLTVLMGINGANLDPEDPKDVKYCYQNYETCKAGNIQLIFYRPTTGEGEVLIKCLLNGSEATLPLPSEGYPYYKWSDFKAYYEKL